MRASGPAVLRAESAGADAAFVNAAGQRVLRYSDLFVRDHKGTTLPSRLRTGADGRTIILEVDWAEAEFPIEIDPLIWNEQKKLVAGDKASLDYFGSAVAISADGNTVYVNGRDKQLWALNAADGTVKWSAPLKFLAQTPPTVAPDGTIIAAQKGLRTAFINLGRKDLLQSGTIFQVRSSKTAAVKCKALVTSVGEDRSEVALSDFADEVGDFVRNGDQLYNDLYSPRVSRAIATSVGWS